MDWTTMLDRFDAYQRAASLSERTIGNRRQTLERLAGMSGVPPQRILLIHLLDYLNRPHGRNGGPLSPGTKQVERSYLQVWGEWMLAEGLVDQDPAARLPKVKVPRRRARPVHMAHVEALFALDIWSSTKDLITVLANTGLRVGEAVRIRGEHLDPIAMTLWSKRKGGIEQTIHLTPVMLELAARMPKTGWWFPSPYTSSQFPEGGGHILMKSASTKVTRALRNIGITDPKITGHSIRHFYACMLLATGTPLHVVQEMLGHASLATTQLYILAHEDEIMAAVERIPRIAPGGSDHLEQSNRMVA